MTKTILLGITLLASTAWMAAQSTPSSGSQDSTAGQTSSQSSTGASQSTSGMNGSETTIRGCLNSAGGGYTLTDASGTTYQLQGDTSKLSAHANEEVEVKGTASGASGAGSAGSSAGSSTSASSGSTASTGAQSFNVTKVKKVSGSCTASK